MVMLCPSQIEVLFGFFCLIVLFNSGELVALCPVAFFRSRLQFDYKAIVFRCLAQLRLKSGQHFTACGIRLSGKEIFEQVLVLRPYLVESPHYVCRWRGLKRR